MQLEITTKHLTEGRRNDPHACPIALALMDRFPEATYVEVGHFRAIVHLRDGTERIWALFPEAWYFTIAYDNGETLMRPRTLTLRKPVALAPRTTSTASKRRTTT